MAAASHCVSGVAVGSDLKENDESDRLAERGKRKRSDDSSSVVSGRGIHRKNPDKMDFNYGSQYKAKVR